jgi:hypothetical protein
LDLFNVVSPDEVIKILEENNELELGENEEEVTCLI